MRITETNTTKFFEIGYFSRSQEKGEVELIPKLEQSSNSQFFPILDFSKG
jgi:hypothetical protein